ncbi:MAG: ornithine carbamoyltransferase [Deltaproteobacteria bacterium]|nr:ornithine carbamoyltransferase [Deltaproteobacteria bacterium]MCB9490308.1 ornithine carbamoyltransferase [Deltaproteobacteria bacterium]
MVAREKSERPVRHFLSIADWTTDELTALLRLAADLKAKQKRGEPHRLLEGKSLAMIFEKSSTRTRVSFEVGIFQLGGQAIFLAPAYIQMGRGEPIRDTARVLSAYAHGVMCRTYAHDTLLELAEYSSIPVINGLSDLLHPCQVLADVMTVIEHLGDIQGKTVAWIGDGNNMANSWLNASRMLGFTLRLACPPGYQPDEAILARAEEAEPGTLLTEDPAEAAEGADVVTTDVWASMGQEDEAAERRRIFAPYQVNAELMARASDGAIFLHCLPAHRGEEVTEEVFESPASKVWDEAENRLHLQKAIMATIMCGEAPTG